MNVSCFKTVFSKRLGALVAVGEHAVSQGKANGASASMGCTHADACTVAWAGAWAEAGRFVGLLAAGFAAVSLAWAQPAATALPSGGVVAQGAVAISQSGANMNIAQGSAKAVVNWQSFDIGKDARVNIQQPGADAVLLNRVTGANPSQIFGQLNANGQVVLVNPSGVLFGRDGSVTATSFTASTLGISDANFMAGNMQFERNGSTAGVVNQGSIRSSGGYVALLGASVSNKGRIETQGGTAYLAAAESVRIPVSGSGRIKLELSPAQINAQLANAKEGTIVTQGGQVYMQAAALQDAVASIVQSGSIDTTGAQGGAVHVLADGGQIRVDGRITANSSGKDGQSQPLAGGNIYIGRDKDTNVLAAVGDVRGARLESQGGFVETSGGLLKTDEVSVKAREWLLDPYNITIGTTASGTPYASTYTAGATSTIRASDIATSLNNGTNVTISTGAAGSAGADAGDIAVNASINTSGSTTTSLTLQAARNITFASGSQIVRTGSGALNVTLNANFGTANSGYIDMKSGSGITSNGGHIVLGGGSAGNGSGFAVGHFASSGSAQARGAGVQLFGATLDSGAGNITIRGQGDPNDANWYQYGVLIDSSNRGIGGTGSRISTSGGSVTITGTGGGTGGSIANVGIQVDNNSRVEVGGAGTLTMTGTGGSSATGRFNHGFYIAGNAAVRTVNGNMALMGTGGQSGSTQGENFGLQLLEGGTIESTGTGSVNMTLVGGQGGNTNDGLRVGDSGNNTIRANSGSISITATAGAGTASEGIDSVGATNTISSTSGNVTLTSDSANWGTSTSISAAAGTLTVQNRTANTLINVGSTTADASGADGTRRLSISSAEYGRLSANHLVIGAANSGNTTVSSALTLGSTPSSLTLISGNDLTLNLSSAITKTGSNSAALNLRAGNNVIVNSGAHITSTASAGALDVVMNSDLDGNGLGGIQITSANVLSNGGSITLGGGTAGNGTGAARANSLTSDPSAVRLTTATLDARVGASASATVGGNISINGQGNATLTRRGLLAESNSTIATAGSGNIDIRGTGGTMTTTGGNHGLEFWNTTIQGSASGTTTINGTGGASTREGAMGIQVGLGSAISTAGGNLVMTGTGGGSGASTSNHGIRVLEGTVSAGGSGTVTLTGTGGNGDSDGVLIGNNDGSFVLGTRSATVSSAGGAVHVTATSSGTGTGINVQMASRIGSTTVSAPITLTTDSLNIDTTNNASVNAVNGTLTVVNRTANTLINVGSTTADSPGADGTRRLSISSAEYGRLSAGTLVIGATNSGDTTVSSALTMGNIGSNLTINSGNNLTVNGTITGDTSPNDNLQLRARRDVVVNSALDLKGGDLFVQSNVNSGTQGIIDINAPLTGRHVTLENTGGTIDASTGAITRGVRRSDQGSGVTIDSNITASGNLNIFGASGASSGIQGVDITGRLSSANFRIEGDANPGGFNHSGVNGLRLRTGAQIIGTATTGNNLIQGTYSTPQYGSSNAVLLGDTGTASVSITSAAALNINGSSNYSAVLNSSQVGRGIFAQGTLTTSGNITWTGTSLTSDGIHQSNGTINHSGGPLTINGTSSPPSIGTGYTANGIFLGGNLTVTDGSNLSMTGTYTARGANSGTARGFASTGLIRSTGSTPGTLNITGTATAPTGATTAEVGVSVNALSGWGNTTLLAQNPAGSSQAALSTNGIINVGSNQLNVLANGGQIFQAGASSWTAGRITVDNTGAGRSSLIADNSNSPNAGITSGQSFGGSINADGSVSMGNAAVTRGSLTRGLDLNGTMSVTGDVNMATNSGAFINSQITSSAGKVVARALGTLTSSRIMNASTGVDLRSRGNMSLNNNITNSTSGDVVLAAGDGTTGTTATFTALDGATITQAANGNVELTTDGQGNLVPARIRKTGTGAGDIVIAAGRLLPAGDASGGQVTPLYANNNLVNSGTGNSYVYSGGTTTGTGNLSLLASSLGNLDLVGGITAGSQQNAQTNVAYNAGSLGIGGSTARVQALFRGTVPLSGTLNGATVTKTYGDSSTHQANGTSLWADVVTALKAANTGNISASGTAGTFRTSRASLIDGMTPKSLTSPSYSSSNHLNANASGYTYAALDTSGGGATWTSTGPVRVVVNKASLSALSGSKTYNGQVATLVAGTSGGTLTLTGVAGETASLKTGESVAISSADAGSRTVTAAGIASLSNSKLASGATLDLNNYDLGQTVASNNVTVNRASLASISGSKTYDGQTATLVAGTSGGTLSLTGVAGETASLKAGQGVAISSADAGGRTVTAAGITSLDNSKLESGGTINLNNYDLSQGATSNSVTVAQARLTAISGSKTYDGQVATLVAGTSGGTLTLTGVAGETASLKTGEGVAISSPDAGSRTVTAAGIGSLSNSQLASGGTINLNNYDLNQGAASNSVTVNKAQLTAISGSKTYDGLSSLTVGSSAGALTLTGVNGESASIATGTVALSGKDVATHGQSVTAITATGLSTASNSTLNLNNYDLQVVPTPGVNNANNRVDIGQASLTVTANDDAKFVTRPDVTNFNGVRYSGFVGGEDASVLGGTLSITRSNAGTEAAGTYSGVLQASGLTSSNYSINYVAGNYTIVRANQLLIRTPDTAVTYGSTPTYNTTAQYLDGSNNQIYTLTRTGSAGNYTFDDGVGGLVAVQLKAYNGTSLAGQSSSGRTVVGSYSVKDLLPQVTGNNFVGDPVFVGSLTVNTLGVTPTVSGVSKVYDGGKAMSNLVLDVNGKLTGDALSLGGVGTYDQKNVGSGLGYQVTGLVLDGADKGNYHIVGGSSLTGNNGVITHASLTAISGRKTYDGQSSLTVGSSGGTLTFSGVNGETASLTAGTVTLSGKDVSATGQSVTAITANGLSTAAGSSLELGNYDLSTVPAAGVNNRIDIDKARLTVLTAEKTYDGQSTVTSSQITRIEGVNGETFTASGGTANIASKNVWVSDNRITSISGLQLAGQNGALTGNYSLDAADLPAAGTNTNRVVVQRLALTGVTIDAAGSTYGGTVTPGAVNFSASNRIAGDQIAASATVVSTGSDLSTSGHLKVGSYLQSTNGTLSGSDAGNYSLASFSTASANYQVDRKAVTVSGITANDKTYNGDAVATLSTSGVNFDGKVSGDNLGVASVTGSFDDPHVGNGKTVTLSNTTYNGNDRDNYTITDQASTRASITTRALTARLVGTVSKVYDGNTDATLARNNFVLDGFVTGEGASVSQTVGTYASKNVNDNTGTGEVSASLLPTHLSATGSTRLSNYTLPATASGHVGTITPAALTIKVGDTQAFVTQDARTANHTGFTYDGLKGTDTPTSALVQVPTGSDRSYTGSSHTPAVGTHTEVYGLSSTPVAQHGNYTITVQKGALEVIAADKMLVTIAGQTDTYGNRTAGNAGQASSVIAQYCLDASNCNGANLYSLGLSAGSGNGWSGSDNTNTTISFETTVNTTGQLSTGGFLKAGEHSWGVDNVTASSGNTSVNLPFNGVSVNSGKLTVDRLSLTPTANAVSKVYDGTRSAAGVTLGITHEAKTGDDLSAIAGSGSFSTKNVVSSDTVTFGNLSLQGDDRDNYRLAVSTVQGMGSITPATLNVALSAQTKTYDGNTSATLASGAITATGVTVNGVTETVTVNQSVGTYNSKNVVDAASVTASLTPGHFSAGSGVDLGNYILPTTVTGSGTITPKTVGLVARKTYDGTTTLTGNQLQITTGVGTETLGFSNASLSSKNVADNATNFVSAVTLANGDNGGLASNYTVSTVRGDSNSATIDKANLNVTLAAQTKTYDGTTTATLASGAITATGVTVGGVQETFTVTQGVGTFASKNVRGTDDQGANTVTATLAEGNFTAANGVDLGNYNLPTTVSGQGTITAKSVTYTGLTVATKTYDRSTNATLGGTAALGTVAAGSSQSNDGKVIVTDTVSLTGSAVGTYTSKNVAATNNTVTFSGLSLSGADASNYSLVQQQSVDGTGTILAKTITPTAQANDKIYDGTSGATLVNASLGSAGVISGDNVTIGSTGASFADRHVAKDGSGNVIGKTVTVSGLSLDGADASNYALSSTNVTTTAKITPKALTLAAVTDRKTYDGTINSSAGVTVSGLVSGNGITDNVSGLSQSFASKNVLGENGSTLQVNGGFSVNDGNNGNNYSVSTTTASGTIDKANLLVALARQTKTYDGTTAAPLGSGAITATGVTVGGVQETFTVNQGVGTYNSKNVLEASTVTATLAEGNFSSNNGTLLGNYNLPTAVTGEGRITPRALTARLVGPVTKVYDGYTNAALAGNNFFVDGFVTGEGASVSQTVGTYASKNVHDNTGTGEVSASLLPTHLSATGSTRLSNYTLPATASGHVGTITPAALTIKVGDTQAFVTQDARTANHTGFTYDGLKGTDTPTSALVQVPTGSDRSYTGSSHTPAVGTHTEVYGLSSTPVAQHGNYTITVLKGGLEVIAADKMLVTIAGQTDTYGNRTAGNAGQASSVIAQYCLDAGNCNGANLYSLGLSAGSGNGWSGSDNTNTTISFETTVNTTGQLSSGGFLKAGEHSWGVGNVTASSGNTSVTLPFNGVSVNSGTLQIAKLALTGVSIDAAGHTYGSTVTPGAVNFSQSTLKTGDQIGASASVVSTGSDLSTSGQLKAGSYRQTSNTLNSRNANNDADNYTFDGVTTSTANYTVARKGITLSGITAENKTYDGNTTATVSTANAAFENKVAGDNLTVSSTGSFIDKNAGTGKTVNLSNTLGGADRDNYTITDQASSTASITPRALTARLVGTVSKVYDGNTDATLAGNNFVVDGFVTGEGASVSQTVGTYASKNVNDNTGTGEVSASLLPTHLSATGSTRLSNYTLPATASGHVGTITPAALTIKVGDTQAFVTQDARTANHTGFTYDGLKGTDTPTSALVQVPTGSDRSYTGSSHTPAVGTHTEVYGLSSTPVAQHGNYTITVQKGALEVIAADKMLVTIAGQTDTYGNRTAGNAGQASAVMAQYCLVATDCNGANLYTLGLSAGTGNRWSGTDNTGTTISFDTTVNTSGQLSGGGLLKAGNHQWGVGNVTASGGATPFNGVSVNSGTLAIDRLNLTPTANAVSKVYDGTRSAAGVTLVTGQARTGDDIRAIAGSGSFSTRNVVSNDTVTFGSLSLQGNDRDNYALAITTVQGAGAITPKALALRRLDVNDKLYDGTRTGSLLADSVVFDGLVAGDSVGLSVIAAQARFAGKDVMYGLDGDVLNQAVAITGLGLSGTQAGNYTLPTEWSTFARVLPRPLTILGSSALDKAYDGLTSASIVSGSLVNLVPGETLDVAASGHFEDPTPGSAKPVAVRYRLLTTATGSAGNYVLHDEVLRASIFTKNVIPVPPVMLPPLVILPVTVVPGSKVAVAGGSTEPLSAAATASEAPAITSVQRECSILNHEDCECRETLQRDIDVCLVPDRLLRDRAN